MAVIIDYYNNKSRIISFSNIYIIIIIIIIQDIVIIIIIIIIISIIIIIYIIIIKYSRIVISNFIIKAVIKDFTVQNKLV